MNKLMVKSYLKILLVIVFLIIYAAGAYVFSRHSPFYDVYKLGNNSSISYEQAKVKSIIAQDIQPDSAHKGLLTGLQNVTVEVLTGKYKGHCFTINNGLNQSTNYKLSIGQTIIVSVNTTGGTGENNIVLYLYTPNREPYLYLLAGLFVLLLFLIGGQKGIRSVLGIVFTLVSVIFVFIPLLYSGVPTLFAAVILAAVTTCVTLFLISGINAKSLVAVIGTVTGVTVSAWLLAIFQGLTYLSGYTMGESGTLLTISANSKLQMSGLLFVSVLIASLGAVMDMAISVAASANEVYLANPNADKKEIFRSCINVGRDMMGTMSNTLILAFTGNSLNLLILIYTYNMQYYQIINSNTIAIEITQALIGSIGVLLSVPIVALTSAWMLPILCMYKRSEKSEVKTV